MAMQTASTPRMEKVRLPILSVMGIDFVVSGPVNLQTGKAELLATQISHGAFTPKVVNELNATIRSHYFGNFDLYIIQRSSVLN